MMIRAIVTDIEGTTTSLSFVKDILFPYARANLPEFIRQHQEEREIKQLLADAQQEAGKALDTEATIDQIIEWIDQDKKITPLKSLQGLIWKIGYQQGDLKGHLYPDAIANLQAWKAQGIDLYVYSSGSVLAQKLLFGHTESGDLTPLFSGFFDTTIGGKKETTSYSRIADNIALPAANLMFLSDIKAELDAAKAAGYHTYWLNRDETLDANAEHKQVSSFNEIKINQ